MNTPPIPVPDPDEGSLIFRCSFSRFYVTTNLIGIAWSLPVTIPFMLPTRSMNHFLAALGVPVVSALIVGMLFSIIVIELYPVIVNEKELSSTNAWGKKARVKWSEISSVKRINFLTLHYLKISTFQKKNAFWLPLYLSDIEGFRVAVAEFAAPENPLRVALER